MEILISLIMGTRLLTLFGGGLGHEVARAVFLPPRILVTQEDVRLNCTLTRAFSGDLKKLAATATPIVIYLFVDVKADGGRRQPGRTTVESRLWYDLIDKSYRVTQSLRADTLRTASIDSAIVLACRFEQVPVARKAGLAREATYRIAAWAVLGKTAVAALDNKEVDLMYYWDFKRPGFQTEKISGGELLQ